MRITISAFLFLILAVALSALGNASCPTPVKAVPPQKVFVSAEWVKSAIEGKQAESKDMKVFQVGWGPSDRDKDYLAAHLPGAVHLNTDEIEESSHWNIRKAKELKTFMSKNGVTKNTTVIVYGADAGATRAAFVFLYAGVKNVKVLNGGLKVWVQAGYETKNDQVKAAPTTKPFGVTIPAHPEYVLSLPKDVKKAMAKNSTFRLVSIRSLEEFQGKISGYSYIKKAGEPQGAVWGHDESDYRHPDGTFISFEKAVAMWKEQGITKDHEIAFYCGTGWRATIPFLMAYENGWKNVKLYDGGWFLWQRDDKNPVQAITPQEAAARYQ